VRILYLSPCAQLGGAERCLLDCLAGLKRERPTWQLHLIAGEDGPLLAEAEKLGVTARCLPFPADVAALGTFGANPARLALDCLTSLPAAARYRRRLHREIQHIAPHLIHTNGLKMHLFGAWAGASHDSAPVIWHLHDYAAARAAAAHALRFSRRGCQAAIAVSQSVAAEASSVLGPRIPVTVMHNAVDLTRFHPRGPRIDLDAAAGMPAADPETVRIGLIGTFAKWKGHEVFLRALSRPEMQQANLRAYIIGGPIYRTGNSQYTLEELKRLARGWGLEDRVGFTGFIEDVAPAMRSLDLVVHASTEPEPFGLAIAEAMACGRAVIAAKSGGASEIFCHGYDAMGTPPGDDAALAHWMLDLIRHPAKRMCLASAARATALARFDRARLGRTLASLYLQTVTPCASYTFTAEISTAA
jgi:glycosyltransferase involved in cell wall biosynthesis